MDRGWDMDRGWGFGPHQVPLSSFQLHGWEASFVDGTLMIRNDSGFRFSVQGVNPASVSVRVAGSAIQILVGPRPVQVEFCVSDDSARSWMIRFLHFWGFPIDGVRIEQGVIVPLVMSRDQGAAGRTGTQGP